MFIKMTEHYKGSYPVDLGGLLMHGPEPKFVEDDIGRLIARANFPLAVACKQDGEPLSVVPPARIEEPRQEPKPEQEAPKKKVEAPKPKAVKSEDTDLDIEVVKE